jgi:hypothetical protein
MLRWEGIGWKVVAPPPFLVRQPQVSSLRHPYAGILSIFEIDLVVLFFRYSTGISLWPTSYSTIGTTSIKLFNDGIRILPGAARALPFVDKRPPSPLGDCRNEYGSAKRHETSM